MKSNFKFLNERWPILAQFGNNAENYVYTDPNSSLMKLGLFAEKIVNLMFDLDGIKPPTTDNTHANRIRLLKKEDLVPKNIDDILYSIRIPRNKATHDGYGCADEAKILLELSYKLGVWFMQTYGDWNFEPEPFVLPEDISNDVDYDSIIKAQEEEIERLLKENAHVAKQTEIQIETRKKRANTSANNIELNETETRYLIDEQLRKVGWEADTLTLSYSKGVRPQKGKNIAIAEWPTDSNVGNYGKADYALFVGLKLVGIIEAKKYLSDIPSVIDNQCKDYATKIKKLDDQYVIGSWGQYKVPFLFATNGRKYLKQLETKSGVWFLDARESSNIPRALQGWMSPEGLLEELEKDIESANNNLTNTSYDLLTDKDGLNLREYQVKAIESAEQAIIGGARTALLAMATGTGKTRTILGMIYRFIKTDRFKRVLFLVDRSSLGEQAQDVFEEVKIEDLMTLNEIYNINTLEDKDIDKETKIHIATVQSLVRRIMYSNGDTMPAVSDYDLIVIDEAHRGYTLDKELGEDEILYRDQNDYISKYRSVIDYFDAVKIALTATPALHTTEIFGKPVFNYSYRQAVIDGYLVDHDAPHNIKTKLSIEGINYKKGETIAIYDPVTGEITNSDELEDEINFDLSSFNHNVITEPFNRTVLEEIANDINPDGKGKTLIYAVDNDHADIIVNILKEIYEDYGIDNNAIMKITGSIGGGNPKKVLEAIRRFKNDDYPNIVVTVDLLTTGIDVPKIDTLVFMRRVRSRILFEQMLGRATRLCPEIGKTHFEIYDPVGVYESLQDVSTMKPVVANPSTTFIDLIDGFDVLETEDKQKKQVDMIIAKLQRKSKNLNNNILAHFKNLTSNQEPSQFINNLKNMTTSEAKAHILSNRELFEMLNEGGHSKPKYIVISDKEDELISHERGYGKGVKPEDYIKDFGEFIKDNMNQIAALKVICTKPSELTRESLKSLKLELDRNHFTEKQLNTAWKELKNEDIVADIISFIRQQALGSTLLNHEERVKNAVNKLKENNDFNRIQLDWIDRIETSLLNETILNKETFNTGAFKTQGGFKRIDKIFKNNLDNIIQEMNEYLYDERRA